MHSKEVERQIEVDILYAQVLKATGCSLGDRPQVERLMRIYCDSLAVDDIDFEQRKGTIACFMREIILNCSEEKAAYVLEHM